MASSSSSSQPVKIPLPEHLRDYPPTSHRRRRDGRYTGPGSLDSSDAGPSSLGSDQDSSWPGSLAGTRSIASPANQGHMSKDPRMQKTPLSSDSYPGASPPQGKDKAPVRLSTPPPSVVPGPLLSSSPSPLGPSMRLSTSYKSINLNEHYGHHSYDPDEPPRLITYTKSAQGFTWNDELFLPSYLVHRHSGRGRRKTYDGDFDEEPCPVAEIFITDEDIKRLTP